MVKEKEEVVTAVSNRGDTATLVCKTNEDDEQQLCIQLDKENEGENLESLQPTSRQENMLDNNTYNVMEQLSIENRSLWRIKNNYKRDANLDDQTLELWSSIEKEKEQVVKRLTDKLRARL